MIDIPVAAALPMVAATTLMALAVRTSLLRLTLVTSSSMLPTLRPGSRRLTVRVGHVDRLARGDIVVVRSDELGLDVVKRVVGLPGEAVRIEGSGAVWVDGMPLDEPHVRFPGGPGGSFLVPADSILVLGDNRAASNDGRHWHDPYIRSAALRGRLVPR